MRIRILRNLGRNYPDYYEGQVVETDKQVGQSLCEQGLAEVVIETIKAIPPEPVIAIPSEPEIVATTLEETERPKRKKNGSHHPTT